MKLFKLTSSLLAVVLVLVFSSVAGAVNIFSTSCPGSGCVNTNVIDKGAVSFQIGGTWAGTIQFEVTTDEALGYESLPVRSAEDTSGALVTSTSSNGLYVANVAGYLRVRVRFSSFTSGTAAVTTRTSAAAQTGVTSGSGGGGGGGAVTQSGTWTVQPGNTANTTAWKVTGAGGVFPVKDILDSGDVSVLDATNHAVKIIGVAGGAAPIKASALSNTAVQISAAAGILDSIVCINPNNALTYLQFYDNASPTVGTTVAAWSVGMSANGTVYLPDTNIAFIAAIKVAATTTAGGSTAPSTAVDCNFGKR